MTETKDIHIRELQKMVAHFRERAEDLEMMLKGAIQRGGELLAERDRYRAAIEETLEDNRHLADGEDCTLINLKRSIGWESGAEK